MNEMLLVSNRDLSELFYIIPLDSVGSTTVTDSVGGYKFSVPSGTSSVKFDSEGDKCLDISNGHFENLNLIDLKTAGRPFKIEIDINLRSYPSTEGAILSQLNPNTGGGTFGVTMYNGPGGPGRVSFFWTSNGSLGSRSVITSDRDLPLNTYVHLKITHDGSSLKMYFDDTLVAQTPNGVVYSKVHSTPLPVGIGGHYSTNSYNMNGLLKNIHITRF